MSERTHHLHHLHLCIQAQLVEEHLEIFLHLDRVVVHLGHREDSHLALPPHLQRQDVRRSRRLFSKMIFVFRLDYFLITKICKYLYVTLIIKI